MPFVELKLCEKVGKNSYRSKKNFIKEMIWNFLLPG